MEPPVSYRQVGRESPGRVYRHQSPVRDCSPAFGTCSARFTAIHPLSQHTTVCTDALPSHSLLGRMDKSKRFKPRQYASVTPGPGSYTWKPSGGQALQSMFVSKETRSVSPVACAPPPGLYDPKIATTERSASSVFRSNVKRLLSIHAPAGPAPWHYSPMFSTVRKSKSSQTAAFKRSVGVRRFQVNIFDPASKPIEGQSPGPGSYEVSRDLQPSAASLPSAVFKSSESRFPTPHAVTPEPGSYDTLPKQSPKLPVSGAVFRSDTTRMRAYKDTAALGPGSYRAALLPKRQSFLLNLSKRWVQ